jgi:hypothetical protein
MSNSTSPSGSIVHEIRWSDALPWWLLFRAAGAAFSPTVILLAALGAAAVWAGWSAADRLGLEVPATEPVAVAPPATDTGLALATPEGRLVIADPLAPSTSAVPWLASVRERLVRPRVGDLRHRDFPLRCGQTRR